MTNTLESAPVNYDEQPQAMANIEVHDFGRGQILRYSPPETRTDESTGEPVIPLVYFQGINGDNSLPAVMQALGERDKRPVIAIRYTGKLKGSDKPLSTEPHDYGEGDVVPEIANEQADDMLAALDVMGVEKGDAVATSKGGLPWLVAMKKRPERFRNAYGDDVAGQDGRNYKEAHIDADQHVQLVETDKGGHGIGTNSLAIDNALEQLREMERKETAESQAPQVY